MNAKKLLVSFLSVMSVLLLVITVSAITESLVENNLVKVDGQVVSVGDVLKGEISVIAGQIITVEVFFTALHTASDVRIEVELQGSKTDSDVTRIVGDVEKDKRYSQVLTLQVPHDLDDELSDNLDLEITVFSDDFKTDFDDITIRVQRPSYNAAVMLIQTASGVSSGDVMSVNVVLKNIGYNDLDDTFITVRIPALDIENTDFLGDIVAIECEEGALDIDNYGVEGIDRKCNEDDEDSVKGNVLLNIPFDVPSGIYLLEVEVRNVDLNIVETKQIFITNEVPQTVLKSGNSLIIVNPTDNVKVYTIIVESPGTVSESLVVVPAGSSKTVTVDPNTSGKVSVNVLLGNVLVGTVEFAGVQDNDTADSIVVLTIVLAIIFVVLVIVLLVLLTRKPEKDEEFSESYY